MDQSCIFCKIIAGEIPAHIVERDDDVMVITDVNPQAPVHLLVMPIRHFANINAFVEGSDQKTIAHLFAVAARVGASVENKDGDTPGGYRLVVNTGVDGGQTVDHLHVHILAGRHMGWPPG